MRFLGSKPKPGWWEIPTAAWAWGSGTSALLELIGWEASQTAAATTAGPRRPPRLRLRPEPLRAPGGTSGAQLYWRRSLLRRAAKRRGLLELAQLAAQYFGLVLQGDAGGWCCRA
jgi:hypothetical protein